MHLAEYHVYSDSVTEQGISTWAPNVSYPIDAAGRQQLADLLDRSGFKPTQVRSKMRIADIEQIADAMLKDAGAFWATVSPFKKMIIGPGGEVLDGHHRVIASVISGKPIPATQIFRFPGTVQRPVFNWIDVLPQ
jgi:hypothetical protein